MAPKKKILNDYGSLSSDEEAVELPEAPSSSALDRLANRMVGDVDEMSQLLKSSASDASNPNDGHKATTPVKKVLSSKALLIRFAALAFSAIFLVGLLTWTVCSVSKKIHHKALPVPSHARKPFSKLDPVQDLGLYAYERPRSSRPPHPMKGLNSTKNFPTNAWYQNMLMAETPGLEHRAYAIPYIVDAASPIPGLRVHPNHVTASNFVVQMNIIEQYGLTLGAYSKKKSSFDPTYVATHATPLGVTLEWDAFPMYSSITKGMPYATMRYRKLEEAGAKPVILSQVPLMKPPVIDKTRPMSCHGDSEKNVFLVESEVELLFDESDFTWLIFVSEPVLMHCVPVETTGGIRIEVVEFVEEPDVERELVIRAAVSKLCSTGLNPVYCHQERMHPTALMIGQGQYDDQLRNHSRCFPGPNTAFDYKMEADGKTALMEFDWDVQNMEDVALHPLPRNETFLCMGFALPHHFDIIVQAPPTDRNIYCVSSLVGPACLYEGGKWQLREPIPEVNFRAPRPPAPWSISDIADSLKKDINYTLPDYYLRGAGDTYFSGKMLAKLGRILLIAEELQEICNNPEGSEYSNSCKQASLPSDANFSKALARLKSSTEIWINGTAETEFVYDVAWGGVVSCGCLFNGKHGTCDNKFPDCSAFGDPGLNFGNGFYNDQHFHYGYMIYAAAVVAHFDPAWGRDTFERVLLLIRAIANPSVDDHYFVPWRQKDWFSGHSWASGIATSVQNGKNQESSSEAIAAYEAIALYGSAMVSAWQEKRSKSNTDVAREIQHAGELLAATELRSAKMYWHVQQDAKVKIYPSAYTPFVVGILWQGMAQLQTWFGSAQHLAYGIQLLPITTISEHRDTLEWSSSMYNTFAKACSSDPSCETYGWSVLPLAILATVGHPQTANEMLKSIPEDAFESAGGNGHSLTNSLWYSATRPVVEKPLNLDHEEKTSSPPKHSDDEAVINKFQVIDCGVPRTCTDYVLDTIAGLYSCRQRIEWLMQEMAQSEQDACIQVAAHENPFECGKCNPLATDVDEDSNRPPICPACTIEQCRNPELNRCPEYKNTFVCTDGSSTGGCQNFPWELSESQCHSCCELTNCPKPSAAELQPKVEAECPVCSRETCRGSINRCPSIQGVQYLCLDGTSKGGCSNKPWLKETDASPCTKCCTLLPFCDK